MVNMHDTNNVKQESESPPSPSPRLKRDEWSEGAVSCLLEAYETKWALRNRAKLKGQDWEDVASQVTSRGAGGSTKTQTQCKNKIESMKKRYRSEFSSFPSTSSWPLFSRIDRLMRGAHSGLPKTKAATMESHPPLPLPLPSSLVLETAQNFPKSNGARHKDERVVVDEEGRQSSEQQVSEEESKKDATLMNNESSTPALYGSTDEEDDGNDNKKKERKKKKKVGVGVEKRQRKRQRRGIAESLQVIAEAVVMAERARMDTLREVERMRVEGEARRAQMELNTTHIIASTQLHIARIFAARCRIP